MPGKHANLYDRVLLPLLGHILPIDTMKAVLDNLLCSHQVVSIHLARRMLPAPVNSVTNVEATVWVSISRLPLSDFHIPCC